MSNKRQLKKYIQQVCGQAALDVMLTLNEKAAGPAIRRLAALQSTTLANVTFGFDHVKGDFENGHLYNKARHAYTKAAYGKLLADFNDGLVQIVKELNSSVAKDK